MRCLYDFNCDKAVIWGGVKLEIAEKVSERLAMSAHTLFKNRCAFLLTVDGWNVLDLSFRSVVLGSNGSGMSVISGGSYSSPVGLSKAKSKGVGDEGTSCESDVHNSFSS